MTNVELCCFYLCQLHAFIHLLIYGFKLVAGCLTLAGDMKIVELFTQALQIGIEVDQYELLPSTVCSYVTWM